MKVKQTTFKSDHEQIVEEVNDIIFNDTQRRKQWTAEAILNMYALDGSFSLLFNKSSRTIQYTAITPTEAYIPVNLMRYVQRGIKNKLTRNEPDIHFPILDNDLTKEERETVQEYIRLFNFKINWQQKLKDLIDYGLSRGLAYLWALPDYDNDCIDVWVDDPLDVYVSPICMGTEDSRPQSPMVIRTMRKSVKKLIEDPRYSFKKEDIQPDDKPAESVDKSNFLYNKDGSTGIFKTDTVILKEAYILEHPKNKEEDECRVRVLSIANDKVGRDEILEGVNEIPVAVYIPERRAGLYYVRAWLTEIRPLNEAYNSSISNIANMLYKGNKVRMMKKSGDNIKISSDKNGEIIEYSGVGIVPQFIPPASINNAEFEYMSRLDSQIEKIGGVSLVSLGTATPNAVSGRAIAQLQAADDNNIVEPLGNLKTCMQDFYSHIVLPLAEVVVVEPIKTDVDLKPMIGAKSPLVTKATEEMYRLIKAPKYVEVEIIPGSAYSDISAKDDAIELFKAGAIDVSTLLESYKIGGVENIINSLQAAKDEEANADPDIKMADAENSTMSSGRRTEVSADDDHDKHLAVHASFLQSLPKGSPVAALLMEHMKTHDAMKQETQGASNTFSPNPEMMSQNQQKEANISSLLATTPSSNL